MEIDTWLRRLSAELGVDDVALDDEAVQTLLDLARDAAHEVGERIAAPLTTFLVGVAVGRGQTLSAAAARATALTLLDELPTDPDSIAPGPTDPDVRSTNAHPDPPR